MYEIGIEGNNEFDCLFLLGFWLELFWITHLLTQ